MLWSAWVSVIVAILATVVAWISLRIANRSFKVSRQLLQMSASTEGTTDLACKADELFLDHPGLRPYFYDRWPVPDKILSPPAPSWPPSEADLARSQLLAATEYYLDLLESIWDNVEPLPDKDKGSWREWIHDMFESGPILVAYFEKNPTWYPTLQAVFQAKDGYRCTNSKHLYAVKHQAEQQPLQPAPRAEPAGLDEAEPVRLQR
jgi:hypothetical protein